MEGEGLENVSLNPPSPITCPLSHALGVPPEPTEALGPGGGLQPETGRLGRRLPQRPAWLSALAPSCSELTAASPAGPCRPWARQGLWLRPCLPPRCALAPLAQEAAADLGPWGAVKC